MSHTSTLCARFLLDVCVFLFLDDSLAHKSFVILWYVIDLVTKAADGNNDAFVNEFLLDVHF